MYVIKIGGCNGSGKTSLVRAIIEGHGLNPIHNDKGKVEAYGGKLKTGEPIAVLGSYVNVCGGMDTISDKHDRVALLERYLALGGPLSTTRRSGILIFEGLITGKTYGKMGEISSRPEQQGKWIYTFMDTPFEECVRRVLERRAAKGNNAPFDAERTMRPTFKSVQSVRAKAKAAGYHFIHDVDHTQTPKVAAATLLKATFKIIEANN